MIYEQSETFTKGRLAREGGEEAIIKDFCAQLVSTMDIDSLTVMFNVTRNDDPIEDKAGTVKFTVGIDTADTNR